MSKPRTGLATILAFNTSKAGYTMTLQYPNGQKAARIVDPEVAHKLAADYGVRLPAGGTRRSMQAIKGAACRYRETSQGLLVEVEVLPS